MHIITITIFLVGFYGWVNNIITLVNDSTLTTGMLVVRAAGIFVAPLGAILGFI